MKELICFVAVDFVDDPKVAGYLFWYYCHFEGVEEGNIVSAPLGRHNRVQNAIVRKVLFADEEHAPFPVPYLKSVVSVVKEDKNV